MVLMAISAPARSIEEHATSISRFLTTSLIERPWTRTSNMDFSTVSGSMPCDMVRLPCGSMSQQRTRWPSSAKAQARFNVVVVLATPPFWFANAMTLALFSTEGSAFFVGNPVRRCIRTCVMDSSMSHIAHWDSAPSETSDLDTIGGHEQWLSGAVGSRRLGASRQQIPAGKASTPQHAEDEEVFYVLGGSGWSVQTDGCFAIGAGDVVYYRPWEVAHTIVAGDEGIDYIAMGTSEGPRGLAHFPRLKKVKVYDHLLEGDQTHQWELENELGRIEVSDPPDDRPKTIVNIADVDVVDYGETKARRFLTS